MDELQPAPVNKVKKVVAQATGDNAPATVIPPMGMIPPATPPSDTVTPATGSTHPAVFVTSVPPGTSGAANAPGHPLYLHGVPAGETASTPLLPATPPQHHVPDGLTVLPDTTGTGTQGIHFGDRRGDHGTTVLFDADGSAGTPGNDGLHADAPSVFGTTVDGRQVHGAVFTGQTGGDTDEVTVFETTVDGDQVTGVIFDGSFAGPGGTRISLTESTVDGETLRGVVIGDPDDPACRTVLFRDADEADDDTGILSIVETEVDGKAVTGVLFRDLDDDLPGANGEGPPKLPHSRLLRPDEAGYPGQHPSVTGGYGGGYAGSQGTPDGPAQPAVEVPRPAGQPGGTPGQSGSGGPVHAYVPPPSGQGTGGQGTTGEESGGEGTGGLGSGGEGTGGQSVGDQNLRLTPESSGQAGATGGAAGSTPPALAPVTAVTGGQLRFDEAKYNQLITFISDMELSLTQSATTTPDLVLDGELALQPGNQVWPPARRLVERGRGFGDSIVQVNENLRQVLFTFGSALQAAKAVFKETDDLALYPFSSFVGEYPDLNTGGGSMGQFPAGGK